MLRVVKSRLDGECGWRPKREVNHAGGAVKGLKWPTAYKFGRWESSHVLQEDNGKQSRQGDGRQSQGLRSRNRMGSDGGTFSLRKQFGDWNCGMRPEMTRVKRNLVLGAPQENG